MIRLVGAELYRLAARRIVWLSVVATLAVVGLLQLAVVDEVTPPTAAERVQAQRAYDETVRDYEQNREEYEREEQSCLAAGEPPEVCEYARPDLADYGLTAVPYAEAVEFSLQATAYLVALVAFVVACSLIGAEYASGAIGHWLTFVPRRGAVFWSKLVVVAAFAVALCAVASVVTLLVPAVAVLATDGSLAGLDRLLEEAARGLVAVAIAACVGFCLGLLARHTVAGLAVLLGYLFLSVVRGGLAFGYPWIAETARWAPETNLEAIRNFGTTYLVPVTTVMEQGGESVEEVQRSVSFLAGLGYWAVVLGVLVAVSLLVFRRRDVT